jgi:hypothetical protein
LSTPRRSGPPWPPLENFLAEKDQILKDEESPDETKLYTD